MTHVDEQYSHYGLFLLTRTMDMTKFVHCIFLQFIFNLWR
jgi:hypothetical protein